MALLSLYRRDPVAANAAWDKAWEAAWHAHSPSEPWKSDTDSWTPAGANLGDWSTWPGLSVPEGLGEPGVGFVGQLWLSTHVALSPDQARQAATLNLGRVTEEEKSWVNGQGIGGNAGGVSHHPLAAGLLHAGDNRITLSVFCSWKNCGLNSPAADRNITLADGTVIALAQPWRFMTDKDWVAPQIPWGGAHGLEQQYNGLIAPIGPYTVKAAIWYQGESDIYFARDYQQTLSDLLADWRSRFGADLPFVVVQIPQYGPQPTQPVSSVWSDLRETQRKAVAADPHAALVVTLDVGDAKNLHPANKQEVGRRIALAMRRLAYGEQVAASGPVGASAHATGKSVVVAFHDVDRALASVSGPPNGFELCTDTYCRWANAHVAGNSVVLDGRARRVRYCWGDSPVCTLTDASGLPAGPFELAVQ
jgi:sialate O-acetylesterase